MYRIIMNNGRPLLHSKLEMQCEKVADLNDLPTETWAPDDGVYKDMYASVGSTCFCEEDFHRYYLCIDGKYRWTGDAFNISLLSPPPRTE